MKDDHYQSSNAQPAWNSPLALIRSVVGGILMGLANLVPGISGGTMLLASGVYPQFINGIAETTTLRLRIRTLVPLGLIVGSALIAIVLLSGTISELVIHHRWIMYSIFIGLTLGGAPILWRLLKPASPVVFVAAAIGIALMAGLAFVQPGDSAAGTGDGHPYLLYFLAGIAGASAMVLPGVSGAYLLLVLGQYVAVLTAVAACKDAASARDWSAMSEPMHVVIPVGIGAVVGVVGISNLVKFLLARFQRATLGLLLGLLLGAVISLWPFQEGVAPEVGSNFRGDRVVMIDDVLTLEQTGRAIKHKDYPTAIFTPSGGQIAASLALILAGFGASTLVSLLGGRGELSSDDPEDR